MNIFIHILTSGYVYVKESGTWNRTQIRVIQIKLYTSISISSISSSNSNSSSIGIDILFIGILFMFSKRSGYVKQGKSEGFDSCDRPSNLSQIGFQSLIFQPVWTWNLMDDPQK